MDKAEVEVGDNVEGTLGFSQRQLNGENFQITGMANIALLNQPMCHCVTSLRHHFSHPSLLSHEHSRDWLSPSIETI